MAKRYHNSEGYPDYTAEKAMEDMYAEEHLIDQKAKRLIGTFKLLADLSGFIFLEDVQLKHIESGKEFRKRVIRDVH